MSKISIRFYKDRKVRAVWDEGNNHWWFSVLDYYEQEEWMPEGNDG